MKVGLIHTVPTLSVRFHELIGARRPDLEIIDIVDPTMLARAIERGAGPDVREDVERHVRHLLTSGAAAVLVTCSSIGHLVDELNRSRGLLVHRVDQAMADEAVRLAAPSGRITVLATLTSTREPTAAMVREAAAGQAVTVDSELVEGAAAARGSGDARRHDQLIQEAVDRASSASEVVVLAQASMASALEARAEPAAPVLTSPISGTERFLADLPLEH